MIRRLNNDEKIKFSKERMDHPFILLWFWLFGIDNMARDFEYLLNVKDAPWGIMVFIMVFKLGFSIPIVMIAWTWKVLEFVMGQFISTEHAEFAFECIICTVVLIIFGVFRSPYVIYTYMRFNRATALMHMIKSD